MIEKTSKIKKAAKLEKKTAPVKKERYFEAVGRRKTAVARVRLFTKKINSEVNEDSIIEINNKSMNDYFPILRLQKTILSPLEKMKIGDKLNVIAKVKGGGIKAQAEAVQLGIARTLLKFNPEFRKRLRRVDLLTRDSRKVERKKYGLKKARRAPQWKKR